MKLFLRIFFPLLVFISLIFIISSCAEDLNFSTSSSDKLTFSADTIRFDTVFTTMGSSTRQFRIYNRSTKPLKIASIRLKGASANGFSVVVDGQRGPNFTDVEIGAKDSIFVFVEVKIDPQNKNNAIFVRDSLEFVTNGNLQHVRFEAYGQDVIILNKFLRRKVVLQRDGKPDSTYTVVNTINTDTTLTGERPFLVYDSLVVAKGAKLTLQPGVRLFFHDQAFCRIDGQISAKGTVAQPIVFRADRMDYLLPDLPFDLYSGQWAGVSISTDSYENEMEYTQIRNGLYALQLDSSTVEKQKIRLVNCKFNNVTGIVLSAFNCNVEAIGCEFSNGGEDVVRLIGGSYSFTHCTMMSDYPFSSYKDPTALHLSNYKLTGSKPVAWLNVPLLQADFYNCLVWGRRISVYKTKIMEIYLDNEPNGYPIQNNPFKYHFDYCLLKADGEDDPDFVQMVWNKDPKFMNVNKDDKFIYDLRLDSLSAAMDKANPTSASKSMIDLNGISRFADGLPDIGAYERVKVKGK